MQNTLLRNIILINIISFIFILSVDHRIKHHWKNFENLKSEVQYEKDDRIIVDKFNQYIDQQEGFLAPIYHTEYIQYTTSDGKVSSQLFNEVALWNIQNKNFEIWQFITHMFLHGGIMHIFFNMFALWSLGTALLNILTNRKFIFLYVTGGIVASLTHMMMTNNIHIPMIGASGAVWSIFAFYSLHQKDQILKLLFLPIRARSITFFWVFFAIEVLLSLFSFGTSDVIAHWAHIGGAFFGFIYFLYISRNNSI